MWLSGFLFAGTIALAQPPQTAGQDAEQGVDEKRLGEIVTIGPELEDSPQTGEFLFHPVIYTQLRGSDSPVRRVDFFFSPIEEAEDGVATLYDAQKRTRFRVSVSVPVIDVIGTRFKPKLGRALSLGTQRLNMPGGSYILSEVRYSFADRTPGAGSSANTVLPTISTRSYCLTEESFAFDVRNGETQFLGGLALAPVSSNRARRSNVNPILGLDERLDLVSGPDKARLDEIELTGFDLLSFDADEGLCRGNVTNVAALAP